MNICVGKLTVGGCGFWGPCKKKQATRTGLCLREGPTKNTNCTAGAGGHADMYYHGGEKGAEAAVLGKGWEATSR